MRADRAIRVLGALVGIGFGLLFAGVGFAVASSDDARRAVVGVGTAVLVVGGLLGFAFAPMAVQPGQGSALGTSARLTALAVPLGAICVAVLQFGGRPAPSWMEWAAGIGAVAFVGLLFLGLPMAGLVFLVVNLWIMALRVVVRLAQGPTSGDIPEH